MTRLPSEWRVYWDEGDWKERLLLLTLHPLVWLVVVVLEGLDDIGQWRRQRRAGHS